MKRRFSGVVLSMTGALVMAGAAQAGEGIRCQLSEGLTGASTEYFSPFEGTIARVQATLPESSNDPIRVDGSVRVFPNLKRQIVVVSIQDEPSGIRAVSESPIQGDRARVSLEIPARGKRTKPLILHFACSKVSD
ncbi:MAG: hypothetical protein RJB38_668 [Pseudomonadota bacterium]|jgi:hypothetical protein